jgi:hypothetical protein
MIWKHRITPIALLNAAADGKAAEAVRRSTQTRTAVGQECSSTRVSFSAGFRGGLQVLIGQPAHPSNCARRRQLSEHEK